MSSECCLNCDGTVYKADAIINIDEQEDECQTVKTSVCRKLPGLPHATIEKDFKYKNCCNDNEGIDFIIFP